MTIRQLLQRKRRAVRCLDLVLCFFFIVVSLSFPALRGLVSLLIFLYLIIRSVVGSRAGFLACPRCKTRLEETLRSIKKPNFCPGCGVSLDAPVEG